SFLLSEEIGTTDFYPTVRRILSLHIKGNADASSKAAQIVEYLSSKGDHFVHERHINIEECLSAGLLISRLEENQDLQNHVLTVHHSFMHSLQKTNAAKIVENQLGIALITATK
ncbi:hypothetical protein CH379_019935, partial [Leptospira ellisii]